MQISRCLIRAAAQAAQLQFERVAVANCKCRGASYKPGPRSHNSILNVWLTRTANFEVRQTGLGPSRTTHIGIHGSRDMQIWRCVIREEVNLVTKQLRYRVNLVIR